MMGMNNQCYFISEKNYNFFVPGILRSGLGAYPNLTIKHSTHKALSFGQLISTGTSG